MLTYSNITPAVYVAVINELHKSSEITPNGEGCTITGSGIVAAVTYSRTSQLVQVQIKNKPWWMPEAAIGGKIEEAIERAQARIARGGTA